MNPRTTDIHRAITGHDPNFDLLVLFGSPTRDDLDERIDQTTLDGQQPLVPEHLAPEYSILYRRRVNWNGPKVQTVEVFSCGDEVIVADCVLDVSDDTYGFRCRRADLAEALRGLELVWRSSYDHNFDRNFENMRAGFALLDEVKA